MGSMVVGIFPNHGSIAKLTDDLKANGFDISRLHVISNETPANELIDTGLRFTYSGDADTPVSSGVGIMTGFGGMGVPGLTENMANVRVLGGDPLEDLLGELEIPDKRHDAYELQLERGRAIAGYPAGDKVEQVKQIFADDKADPVEVF